jgi:peptidoglycan/xylan/chitin deacetylase (PgdA/CDA1 family)
MNSEAHYLLSIDVDDLLIANADLFGARLPSSYRSSLETDLIQTLDLLGECACTATFFVNAQYCRDFGDIVREIVSRGHSVASHGYRHHHAGRISLESFRDDLVRSLDTLSDYQTRIIGYRPPAFTMPYEDEYFQIVSENGIKYVSSGAGYARSNVPRVNLPCALTENLQHIPISTVFLTGIGAKYPVGYGVVSRLLPELVYLRTLGHWLNRNDYFHFYCHSFEVAGVRARIPRTFSWSAAIATRIYMLRCRKRRPLFKKIFDRVPFQAIEYALFNHAAE